MIKINNFIFNENEIFNINTNEKGNVITIVFKDNKRPSLNMFATFEDIEWNYGTPQETQRQLQKELCKSCYYRDTISDELKQLEEKNKTFENYNKDLNNQLDKLEEENKKLKEENKHIFANVNDDELLRSNAMLFSEANELKQRINQALEYIRKKSILCDKWIEVEPLQFEPVGRIDYKSLNKKNVEELLKILKGGKNERDN